MYVLCAKTGYSPALTTRVETRFSPLSNLIGEGPGVRSVFAP